MEEKCLSDDKHFFHGSNLYELLTYLVVPVYDPDVMVSEDVVPGVDVVKRHLDSGQAGVSARPHAARHGEEAQDAESCLGAVFPLT